MAIQSDSSLPTIDKRKSSIPISDSYLLESHGPNDFSDPKRRSPGRGGGGGCWLVASIQLQCRAKVTDILSS